MTTNWYVSKLGLDSNSGNISFPFLTIGKAISICNIGDTIIVNDGIYTENITITKTITLLSVNGRENTIIRSANTFAQATITIGSSASNIIIGSINKGFTIIGLSGNSSVERACLYFGSGTYSGANIRYNKFITYGEYCILGGGTVSNSVFEYNIFDGKTYIGEKPTTQTWNGSYFTYNNQPTALAADICTGSIMSTTSTSAICNITRTVTTNIAANAYVGYQIVIGSIYGIVTASTASTGTTTSKTTTFTILSWTDENGNIVDPPINGTFLISYKILGSNGIIYDPTSTSINILGINPTNNIYNGFTITVGNHKAIITDYNATTKVVSFTGWTDLDGNPVNTIPDEYSYFEINNSYSGTIRLVTSGSSLAVNNPTLTPGLYAGQYIQSGWKTAFISTYLGTAASNGTITINSDISTQFNCPNIPRQVCTFNSSLNIKFRYNTINTQVGGLDDNGIWRSNTVITFDGSTNSNTEIHNNTINSELRNGAFALRIRAFGAKVYNNVISRSTESVSMTGVPIFLGTSATQKDIYVYNNKMKYTQDVSVFTIPISSPYIYDAIQIISNGITDTFAYINGIVTPMYTNTYFFGKILKGINPSITYLSLGECALYSSDIIVLPGIHNDTSSTINVPCNIIGRTSSNIDRPIITTSTTLTLGSSDINVSGIELSSSSNTCISILPGPTSSLPDNGNLIYQNINIDDCKITYNINGIISGCKYFTVTNSELYCLSNNDQSYAINIYSQNGDINISDNIFTTNSNVSITGIYCNFISNDGFINQRNGSLNILRNSNNFVASGPFIQFDIGAEKGLIDDKLYMLIKGNNLSFTSSLLKLLPNSSNSLNWFSMIRMIENTVSTIQNGYIHVDSTGTGNNTISDIQSRKLVILGNTNTVGLNPTGILNVKDVVVFSGYSSIQANIDDVIISNIVPVNNKIVDTTIPNFLVNAESEVQDRGKIVITDITRIDPQSPTVATTVELVKIIPIGGIASKTVDRYISMIINNIPNNHNILIEVRNPLNDIPITNEASLPSGTNLLYQFTVKFIDTNNETISTPSNIQYSLELNNLNSTNYVEIYLEKNTGREFVTNAILRSGSSNIYDFTLSTNSTYSIISPTTFNIPLSSGVGSDPHVMTLYGEKYDLPPISKKWNILTYRDLNMIGNTTGYSNGIFFSTFEIQYKKDYLRVNFTKKSIKVSNGFRKMNIGKNTTNLSKSNRNIDIYYLPVYNGIYFVIDYQYRYVCPSFNVIPDRKFVKGVLASQK